ncbi:hypothetical protein ACQP3J_29075, partial [Escherichia coli]
VFSNTPRPIGISLFICPICESTGCGLVVVTGLNHLTPVICTKSRFDSVILHTEAQWQFCVHLPALGGQGLFLLPFIVIV